MEQQSTANNQQFETVVSGKHSIFDLHLKETFKYRDLIFLFVKRNFVANYKQTILGPLWAIIGPLLSTLVFTLVFGSLAGLPTFDDASQEKIVIPSFLFYMAGNICWSYFSSNLQSASVSFLANANTMGKVYYPRLVAPFSTSFSNLINNGIQFVMFIGFWLYFALTGQADVHVTWWALLIPVLYIQMIMLSVGCGIIISSLTTKYRDLNMLTGFVMSLLHYAIPCAYGLSLLETSTFFNNHAWLQVIYKLNPITPIVTTFRYAVFGSGWFSIMYYLISWGFTIVVFFLGLILFSRTERTFMDTI